MAYDQIGMEVVRKATLSRYDHDRNGTVIKVARKYCTVEFTYEIGNSGKTNKLTEEFEKDTGWARSNGYSPSHRIKTAEEWAADARAKKLAVALRKKGVEVRSTMLTPEQIEAIAAIVGVDREG